MSGESGSVLSLDEGQGIEGPGFKWFDLCFFILYDTFGPSIRGLISLNMTLIKQSGLWLYMPFLSQVWYGDY